MRTLFLSVLTVVSMATVSYAQENNSATAQSKTELVSSKETGNYSFILGNKLSVEEVAKNAQYYVHYFTVNYSDKTNEAKVTMIANDEKTRHVVVRFLTACGIQNVIVDGRTISTEEFYINFMK
ncbi:MAG: hypothetical protein RI883_1352 [Bacteroidota bacterium]|jgi:phosphoheptose isomerase